MALEELEKKLYKQGGIDEESPKEEIKIEGPIKKNEEYGADWTKEEPIEKQNYQIIDESLKKTVSTISSFRRFSRFVFWTITPIMLLLIAGSSFYLYQYFSAGRAIDIYVSTPQNVLAGVPFDLMVNFDNGSKNTLENITLSVFLPEGAAAIDGEKGKRIFTKQMENLESNSSFKEKIPFLIFSNGEEVKNFNVLVSYSSALSTRFEKSQNVGIIVRESGIKIDLAVPEKVLNNEEFEITANYSNISNIDFSDAKLRINYPTNFILKKSSVEMKENSIELGKLNKGDSGEFKISGTIVGQEQSIFEIQSEMEVSYDGEIYSIGKKIAQITIASSPLSLKIETNREYAFPGDSLKYKLVYKNNSDISLSDLVIKAQLNGEMFDFASLKTAGAFNSRDNSLLWNAASFPAMRFVEPGGMNAVEFDIKVKSSYPIKKLSDKNFILKISAEISSPTVPYYVVADKIVGLTTLETKVGGKIVVESRAYFNEPDAGVLNEGSLPPKANQPMNFTIHWIVKNYTTDVKNATIKAQLKPGIVFTKVISSSIGSSPVYNEGTQEITWLIDKIIATKGIVNKPIEAVFQIEAIPSIIQVGNVLSLIGQTTITALDEFTGLELSDFSKELTSRDLSDSGFNLLLGNVIQ